MFIYGLLTVLIPLFSCSADDAVAKTGPQTARSLAQVLEEIEGHYESCEDLLQDLRDKAVLDLGAGRSTFIPDIRKRLGNTRMLRIDLVQPRIVPYSLDQDYLVANATSLPLASESMDRIFAILTVFLWSRHDLNIMREALMESARVLKPGGRLIIAGGLHEDLKRLIARHEIPLEVFDEETGFQSYLVLEKTTK